MEKILIPALIVVALVVVGGLGLIALNSSGAFETWRLEAEANRANAQAERLIAQAELTEEQAELETAKGERILKESQAEVMEGNSRTVNGLMTFWGIVGSVIPPFTFAVGLAVGGIGGLLGGYVIGIRNELSRARATKSEAPSSPFKTREV